MPNIKLRSKEDGTVFSVPEDKANDIDYVSKAYHLTKGDIQTPQVKPPLPEELGGERKDNFFTSPHGFIREGLGQATRGIESVFQNPESMPEGLRIPKERLVTGGTSDIIRGLGEAATPAMIPTAIANPIPAISGLLGGAAGAGIGGGISKLANVSPETQNLSEDIGGILGGSPLALSPKARAMPGGFIKGFKEGTANVPVNKYGMPIGISSGIGALLAHHFNPTWSGLVEGGIYGGLAGAAEKGIIPGLQGALRAAREEPRLFNWSRNPVYEPEFVDPQRHAFSFGREPYEGGPYERRSPLPENMRVMPPDPANRVFNMPGSMPQEVYGERLADYPPLALPTPSEAIPMPPAGSHILNPDQLRGLPPSPIWEELQQTPYLSRGAITMGGKTAEGRIVNREGNVSGRVTREVTRGKENVSKPKVEKPSETTKTKESITQSQTPKTEETKNVITSPDIEDSPLVFTMKEVKQMALREGITPEDMADRIRNSYGGKIVSDISSFEEAAAKYGLNIHGRKIK